MKSFTLRGLFAKVAPSTRGRRSANARRQRPLAARLSIEALEDRVVLAAFTVNTLVDSVDADPGITSLREAITAANSQPGDDSINFGVTGTINLTGALPDLSSNIQVQGPGAASLTVRRDTGGDYRIFTVANASVGIDGLTISNGHAYAIGPLDVLGHGGGIYIGEGSSVTVSNSILSGNRAEHAGGGIFSSGTLTVSNSTLSSNSASNSNLGGEGGGIFNKASGRLGTTRPNNRTLTRGG